MHDSRPDIIFSDNGFSFNGTETISHYEWKDVEEIISYKVDLMTTDDVRLDIHFTKTIITISEEHPCWDILCEQIAANFPMIDPDWYGKIIRPAFATNETILYKRPT